MAGFDLHNRRSQGIALAVAGVVAGLLGLWLFWSGTTWWFMVGNLRQAAFRDFQRQHGEARSHGEAAVSWHDHPAARLASIDLSDPEAGSRLQRAMAGASGRKRRSIATAMALHSVLHGETPDLGGVPDADATLLRQVPDLRQADKRLPPFPDDLDSPSLAVLLWYTEERVHRGWMIGDAVSLRGDGSRLMSLHPRHPAHNRLRMLERWLSPGTDRGILGSVIGNLGSREDRANWIRTVHALVELHPAVLKVEQSALQATLDQRRFLTAQYIDEGLRTAAEQEIIHATQSTRAGLSGLIKRAQQTRKPADVAMALNAAFRDGRYDLVETLLELAPAEVRPQVELAIAEAQWDLPALKDAGANADAWIPRVRHIRVAEDHLAFHLAAETGILPRKPITVTIDGNPVRSTDLRRHGPAFRIGLRPGRGRIDMRISMDEVTLFAGEVQR